MEYNEYCLWNMTDILIKLQNQILTHFNSPSIYKLSILIHKAQYSALWKHSAEKCWTHLTVCTYNSGGSAITFFQM